ncbi:MAG TPA: hypothetical protein VF101_10380 [Gaiellaceae bacterium]
MGFFVTRTFSDGLLETRRYRARCFAENVLCAGASPWLVIVVTLVLGGGAGSVFFAVVATLLVLVVAASVGSTRAAAAWGVVVAGAIVLAMLFAHWLFTHPIE